MDCYLIHSGSALFPCLSTISGKSFFDFLIFLSRNQRVPVQILKGNYIGPAPVGFYLFDFGQIDNIGFMAS